MGLSYRLCLEILETRETPALYGVSFSSSELYTIDTATGAATLVGPLGGTGFHLGLGFRGSNLYTYDAAASRVRELDPVTGTIVGSINVALVGAGEGDLAFRADGVGFLSSFTSGFYSFDITGPNSTLIGTFGGLVMDGLAFDRAGVLFGLVQVGGQLYTIDTATAALTLVGNTGLPRFTCGGLVFDDAGNLFAAVAPDYSSPSALYRLDPRTGTATLVGNMGFNGVTGLAFSPDALMPGVVVTATTGDTNVTEDGAIDIYTIALTTASAADVIIALNPGTQLTSEFASLTFTPANWNVVQTITVTAVDDFVAEDTHASTITHTATSTDPLYNGIAIAAVTVNITDNDVAGLTLSLTTVDLTEGGTSNTYTAVLNSQPTANVIVNLAGDSQVSLGGSTLVFTPGNWNTPQVITVRAVDDTLAEGLHNGLITHTATSGDTAYNGMTRTVTARINDNEAPGVLITQTNGPITILEGTTKTYTAVLNSPPSSDVVLDISPDAQVSVSPASITFTPGDWNVPRPIVVTASDDGVEEGDHVGRITHTTSSASAAFNNLTVAGITASIVDNDGAAAFGTERADQILVSFTTANIKVTVNGKLTILPNTLTQLLLFAGFGNDSIQIVAPTIPVVVVGGPGVDKVFVTGQAASNTFVLGDSVVTTNGRSIGVWEAESLTVGGKAGNDIFTVMDVPAFPVELKGDAGTDVILGPARPNTWQITGANAGTLNTSIKISAMENWTGGDDTDSFVFAAGKSITGRVDGGLGQNTLDFAAATAAITVNLQTSVVTGSKGFANITNLVGGKGGADKLIAADQSNLWNITAANSGSVNGVSFRNFENFTGGIQDDTFLFADNQGVKGKIDGGLGLDLLDFSAYLSRPVVVNLQLKAATNTGGFANLEAFQGGSGTADSLLGANKLNAWNITGAGSGDVGGVAFGNFENLTGGTLADNFTLAAAADWLGTLSGGTGTDTLTAFPGPNSWLLTGLNAGTLNGRKFAAMEVRR